MAEHRIPIPKIDFNPPIYVCRRTSKPFTLDGRLDKDFWTDAPFTQLFADIEGPQQPAPRFSTRAKMLWDDEYLYFGAILEGDEIWASITERDSIIFYDNDFEIFIDPDSDTQQYYEFEMNALNTVWDLFLTKAYRDNGKPLNNFDFHGIRTAVYISGELNNSDADNHFWSVEIAIPFSSISECAAQNRPPINGEYYRINFSRVQWLVSKQDGSYTKQISPDTRQPFPEDNWVWSPTGVINIHYPELWGFVFFQDSDSEPVNAAIPEDEKIKWEMRKLYYAQHIFYDRNGRFTECIEELKQILTDCSPSEISHTIRTLPFGLAITPHTFEISCPSSNKTHLHILLSDGKTYILEGNKKG